MHDPFVEMLDRSCHNKHISVVFSSFLLNQIETLMELAKEKKEKLCCYFFAHNILFMLSNIKESCFLSTAIKHIQALS
jgi:hypothetical protein